MDRNIEVLYIEDDEDIRTIAELAFEDEGFNLEFCESGYQAIEKASKINPDVILIDYMMPGMDGKNTLLELRKFQHMKHIPAIFITAKIRSNEIKKYIDMGAIGVIGKPFDPLTLADDIRRMLKENDN